VTFLRLSCCKSFFGGSVKMRNTRDVCCGKGDHARFAKTFSVQKNLFPEKFVSGKICFKHNKDKNFSILRMYFDRCALQGAQMRSTTRQFAQCFLISRTSNIPNSILYIYIQGVSQLLKQSDWAQIQDFK